MDAQHAVSCKDMMVGLIAAIECDQVSQRSIISGGSHDNFTAYLRSMLSIPSDMDGSYRYLFASERDLE
jgi:hypothetical protein